MFGRAHKHLILFFDINDTMFIGDSAKGVTKDIAISKLLAEHYSAVWDEKISKESMSFKSFVENHLCPGSKRNPDIQKSQNEKFSQFITFLENHQHPLTEEIKQKYQEISQNLSQGNIPKSFIDLINHLEVNQFTYSLVFRTFGKDIHEVKTELFARTSLTDLAHATFEAGRLKLTDGSILQTPADIVAHIKPKQHCAWQDNFDDWRAADEKFSGGKPHFVDFADENVVTIFFDDNALLKEILCVQSIHGEEFDQKTMQAELIRLGRIVPVSTYAACIDNDYFIKSVKFGYQSSLESVKPAKYTM